MGRPKLVQRLQGAQSSRCLGCTCSAAREPLIPDLPDAHVESIFQPTNQPINQPIVCRSRSSPSWPTPTCARGTPAPPSGAPTGPGSAATGATPLPVSPAAAWEAVGGCRLSVTRSRLLIGVNCCSSPPADQLWILLLNDVLRDNGLGNAGVEVRGSSDGGGAPGGSATGDAG